jgi:hypothetical protein
VNSVDHGHCPSDYGKPALHSEGCITDKEAHSAAAKYNTITMENYLLRRVWSLSTWGEGHGRDALLGFSDLVVAPELEGPHSARLSFPRERNSFIRSDFANPSLLTYHGC